MSASGPTAASTLPIYYLDLLRFRPLSAHIAEQFGIRHESPQLLLIQDGECRYDASHMGIRLDRREAAVSGVVVVCKGARLHRLQR